MQDFMTALSENKHLQLFKSNLHHANQNIIFARNEKSEYTINLQYVGDEPYEVQLENINYKNEIQQIINHPNILNYEEIFLFQNYQVIIMEKTETSLPNWILQNQNKIFDRSLFIEISLQILEAVDYLQSKNISLKDFCNENIFIDKLMKIKLFNFDISKNVNIQISRDLFLKGEVKEGFFYIPPEMLQLYSPLEKNKEYQQTEEGVVWSVGISLYLLTGISLDFIVKLTQGQVEYQNQPNIDEDINILLQKMLQINPQKRPTVRKLIECLNELKKYPNQIQPSIVMENLLIEEVEQRFKEGKEFYKNKQFEKSQNIFKILHEEFPNNEMYLVWYARACIQIGDIDLALQLSNIALGKNPENFMVYNVLGVIQLKKNQSDQALKFFKQCLKINPNFEIALYNIAQIYQENNKYDKAIKSYKRSYKINSSFLNAINNIGLIYLWQQKYKESENTFYSILKSNPNYYYPLYNLGIVYYEQKQYKKSIQFLKISLPINPDKDSDETLNRIGNNYYFLDIFEKALKNYKKALDTQEDQNDLTYFDNIKLLQEVINTYLLVLFLSTIKHRFQIRTDQFQSPNFQKNDIGIKLLNKNIKEQMDWTLYDYQIN